MKFILTFISIIVLNQWILHILRTIAEAANELQTMGLLMEHTVI